MPHKKTPEQSKKQNREILRISGQVVYGGRTLLAPLSSRKCVYYPVTVKDSSNSKEVFRNNIDIEERKAADVVIQEGEHFAIINTS